MQNTKAPVTASEKREASLRQGPAAFSMLKATAEKPDTNHKPSVEQSTIQAAQARLATLRAEEKELAAQLKAAKADPRTKLERVIANQQSTPDKGVTKWTAEQLAKRTQARIQAGQDAKTAFAEVCEHIQGLAREMVDRWLVEQAQADAATTPTSAE